MESEQFGVVVFEGRLVGRPLVVLVGLVEVAHEVAVGEGGVEVLTEHSGNAEGQQQHANVPVHVH